MSHYDECVREWTLREGFREGAKLTEGLTETNKTKVCCRTSARNYFCFKDAEIDSCSWNYFPNMTEGSLGVDCPNLEELKAHADNVLMGQKITCKRLLKNRDSMLPYIIYYMLTL